MPEKEFDGKAEEVPVEEVLVAEVPEREEISPYAEPDIPRTVIRYLCRVTGDGGLNIRTQPDTSAPIVFHAPSGTVLNYFEKVYGQNVNGNNCWSHSLENHYYWSGGTDSPFC